ncbi:hypothetical protein ACROYT_G043962, partial [Oculina patagonica]
YFPREEKWCRLRYSSPESSAFRKVYTPRYTSEFVSCRSKLYRLRQATDMEYSRSMCLFERQMVTYNPFTNNWKTLSCTGGKTYRYLDQIFVTTEDEMYALEFEPCLCRGLYWWDDRIDRYVWADTAEWASEIELCDKEKHVYFITKYKPESNSWEDITSFEHLGRFYIGIVAKDDFIYFIGGVEYRHDNRSPLPWAPNVKYNPCNVLTDVDRYDFRKGQWNKVADMHKGYRHLWGAAVNRKIFVAGTNNWWRRSSNFFKDFLSHTYTNQFQV